MSDTGHFATYDDGSKIVVTPTEGGYHRVTFKAGRDRPRLADVTCDTCPCVSVCEHARRCVKGTDYVTEDL